MTEIETFAEEVFMRSLHPSLKGCERVSVVEYGQVRTPLWLVSGNAKEGNQAYTCGRERDPCSAEII